ncbi:MAG: ATP-dependent zinc metalloprotease FtsH [Desulfobacteraceae bacterium]|jgi:cell division protease FtsH
MKTQLKVTIWYVLIGVWIVLILHSFLASAFAVKTIAYSEFLQRVKEGRVSEVAISDNQIEGRMRPTDGAADEGELFRTLRVDQDISDLLSGNDVKYTGRIESNFLGNLLSWMIPLMLFVGVWFFLMSRMQNRQAGFMSIGKSKARVYLQDDIDVRFKDAAGVDEAKQELEEVIDFLKSPQRYTRIGGKIPRGILLVGPPGTGKTLLAKAVAGEGEVPFFSLSGSEFVELFVGMGAARVRDLFKQAKEKAPAIIFIDELDALGKARGNSVMGGQDEREQTLNQILVEMDGFEANLGVILMAATNRPEILDPALLRPGRFDRQILVDRPDKKGRKDILKIYLDGVASDESVDIDNIAAMTSGMVGADLANLVNEAALLAVRRSKEAVSMDEIKEAVERVVAGLEKKNRIITQEEKEIVAYHEMGHAITAMALENSDPVQKISIVPRGISALGYTVQAPTEERFLMRRKELLNRITTLMGGRAAEKIIFGDISTGAQNDLMQATEIARSMVESYGMSTKVGQVYMAPRRQAQFLNPFPGTGPAHSNKTAEGIDEEIRRIIDEQYHRAIFILKQNAQVLEEYTRQLLKSEVIEGKAIELLAKSVKPIDLEGQAKAA